MITGHRRGTAGNTAAEKLELEQIRAHLNKSHEQILHQAINAASIFKSSGRKRRVATS